MTITGILGQTIFGLFVGNLFGLIAQLFGRQKEAALWVSDYFYRYNKKNKPFGILLASVLCLLMGLGFGYVTGREGATLPVFIAAGLLWAINFIRLFDRLYVFSDRIEIKIFFHCFHSVHFNNVKLILRDKRTTKYADIIYYDQKYGFVGLTGNIGKDWWKIPAEVFRDPSLKIDNKVLHPNLFEEYERIKETLPDYPIKRIKKSWTEMSMCEKISTTFLVFINPSFFFVFLPFLFGIQRNSIIFWILMELSRVYSDTYIRYSPKNTIFDNPLMMVENENKLVRV